MAVFGVIDWLARIAVPVMVWHAYGLLAGVAAGAALLATSEVVWRLLTGEWGNLWPTSTIIDAVAHLQERRSAVKASR